MTEPREVLSIMLPANGGWVTGPHEIQAVGVVAGFQLVNHSGSNVPVFVSEGDGWVLFKFGAKWVHGEETVTL